MVVIGLPCGPGCNACCTICSDDFGRADGTDIDTGSGCGWTETAGSWSISSNTLVTSSTSALAKNNTPHPDSISSAVVTCDLSGNTGDKPRIVVDLVDSNNSHFAELTIGTNGCLALYSRIAGVDTLLAIQAFSIAANTPQTVTVYFDGATSGHFGAVAGSTTVATTATSTGGLYVGLGTGGTAAACAFDGFSFGKYYQAGSAESCPTVSVGCAIGTDTFTRADSASIGCPWNVDSGTWSIASNRLTAAGNGVVDYVIPNPSGNATGAVQATISLNATNDYARLHLGYNAGTSICAELKRTSSTQLAVKLINAAGTTVAGPTTITRSSPFCATFCYNVAGSMLLQVGSTPCNTATQTNVAFANSITDPGGAQAALELNGGGTSYFDDFTFAADNVATCPQCQYPCFFCATAPIAFSVTFGTVNYTGCASYDSALSGNTFILDRFPSTTGFGSCNGCFYTYHWPSAISGCFPDFYQLQDLILRFGTPVDSSNHAYCTLILGKLGSPIIMPFFNETQIPGSLSGGNWINSNCTGTLNNWKSVGGMTLDCTDGDGFPTGTARTITATPIF